MTDFLSREFWAIHFDQRLRFALNLQSTIQSIPSETPAAKLLKQRPRVP